MHDLAPQRALWAEQDQLYLHLNLWISLNVSQSFVLRTLKQSSMAHIPNCKELFQFYSILFIFIYFIIRYALIQDLLCVCGFADYSIAIPCADSMI